MKAQTLPILEDVLPKCDFRPNGFDNIVNVVDFLCDGSGFGSVKFEMSAKRDFYNKRILQVGFNENF